jgi:hypothetical protein
MAQYQASAQWTGSVVPFRTGTDVPAGVWRDLDGMNMTIKKLTGVTGPHDNHWVDEALSAARKDGPEGVLIGRPMAMGDGVLVAFGGSGDGQVFQLIRRTSTGLAEPARYAQFTTFNGPRDADWIAAFDRAGLERVWPAVRDTAGIVDAVICRDANDTTIVMSLATTVEALEAAAVAIFNTKLLPWENPAHMTGPDNVEILRLLHVELP